MSPLIRLIIFDWAGTTVDFGSRAPAAAFRRLYAAHGVEVTEAEARRPMGLNKREHLLQMFGDASIAARWRATHGREWCDRDVDAMYHEFMPLQLETIQDHSLLVPGLLETVTQLRAQGLKVGGTSGYFRAAMETVTEIAAGRGFQVDANVGADDVASGRPAPWMIFRVMERLGVYPASAVVNVGDTVADIGAGLAAGCWSIGVCDSSSLTGLSEAEFCQLPETERRARVAVTAEIFRGAGAHATIDSIQDLPSLIERLSGTPRRLYN